MFQDLSCSDDGRVWIEALGALPGPGSTAQEPTKEPLDNATIFRVTFKVIKNNRQKEDKV